MANLNVANISNQSVHLWYRNYPEHQAFPSTTPSAIIGAEQTEYFFSDSGPVSDSSDYTTVVIYYGTVFSGGSFSRLTLPGASRNLRFVVVNRRDYPGTSKHTDEETMEGREFLEVLAKDVSSFLVWVVDHLQPTMISADGKSGGIAVVGLSMGTATTLSLLGQTDVISKEVYAKLESYLHKLIIYDSPLISCGFDMPPGDQFNAITDFNLPSQEIGTNVAIWLTGYYAHPNFASHTFAGLDTTSKRGGAGLPSIVNMKPEEIQQNLDAEVAQHADLGSIPYPVVQPMLREQTNRALFDEIHSQSILPKLDVVYLSCTNSVWLCVGGYFLLKETHGEKVGQGKKARPIKYLEIQGANHFFHWDQPDGYANKIMEALKL